MLVTDLRHDFFDTICCQKFGSKIVIFCHLDVDCLCALKILQSLLHAHQISYSIVVIRGRLDLIKSFPKHFPSLTDEEDVEQRVDGDNERSIALFLNCGATVDLVQDLDLDTFPQVIVFVADSHRPIEVTNVYNQSQIRVLVRHDEHSGIPDYDDIFKDSSDEDDDSDDNDDQEPHSEEDEDIFDSTPSDNNNHHPVTSKTSHTSKTLRKSARRRDRMRWEERRTDILFEYDQFSYHSPSTALLLYDMAFSMSKADSHQLLWWAVLGHTDQSVMCREASSNLLNGTDSLRSHVTRLSNTSSTTASADSSSTNTSTNVDCLKVSFDRKLSLNLFKHWTIYDALNHSIYVACKFKIWSLKGKQKVAEFLADMGLPLSECRQNFKSMDLSLRSKIVEIFEGKCEKYGLHLIVQPSFSVTFGYGNEYCAQDIVHALRCILEQPNHTTSSTTTALEEEHFNKSFLIALESLTLKEEWAMNMVERGIILAKNHLQIVFHQVQSMLQTRAVIVAGPFLYAIVLEGSPGVAYFKHANSLTLLTQYTLQAYVASNGGGSWKSKQKISQLPLILSVPLDEGVCLVCGVPPLSDKSCKNLLGKAFESAVRRTGCRYRLDYYDSSIIQLKSEDRSKFLDALVSIFA